jgi:hypothetical protein
MDTPLPRAAAREIATLVIALAAWVFFLAVGIFVNSGPYRDAIANPQVRLGPWDAIAAWTAAISAYTFTNIAILTVLASLLGAGGRRFESLVLHKTDAREGPRHPYASAILRGFFVYLLALSGLMFFVENVFKTIAVSADSYIRLAGVVSLLSFLIGFSPEMFARLLNRIATLLEEQASTPK